MMKFEEIEVGERYTVDSDIEEVLLIHHKTRQIVTVDEYELISVWEDSNLMDFKPLPPKLPETGLVVGDGCLIMRTGKKTGYGFHISTGEYLPPFDNWIFKKGYDEATKADEKRFKKLLLEKVNKKYKIGDKVKSLYLDNDSLVIDVVYHKSTYEWYLDNRFEVWGGTKANEHNCRRGILLFKCGKFADIIEDEKKDLHEIVRSIEDEELDKLIDILHEKKVTSKFESEGFKIVKK